MPRSNVQLCLQLCAGQDLIYLKFISTSLNWLLFIRRPYLNRLCMGQGEPHEEGGCFQARTSIFQVQQLSGQGISVLVHVKANGGYGLQL